MKVAGHKRVPVPGWQDIEAAAAVLGISREAAAQKLLEMRAREIELEEADPLRYGYEPDIWKVADALLGWEWCFDQRFLRRCRKKFEISDLKSQMTDQEVWEEFGRRMRAKLGFAQPVKMLLVMGGNRSGKTEWAAKRSMEMIVRKPRAQVFALHMSDPRSVRDQQPLFWKYMPPEWQRQAAGVVEYIKYKQKTGFSENSFITPNGAGAVFLNFMQDKDVALQGMEADWVWPDELVPADWLEDIALRLASREGRAAPTFTPINGYTPTVQIFCDGAQVVRTVRAYLCPADGGEWDEPAALGLSQGEYRDIHAAAGSGRRWRPNAGRRILGAGEEGQKGRKGHGQAAV